MVIPGYQILDDVQSEFGGSRRTTTLGSSLIGTIDIFHYYSTNMLCVPLRLRFTLRLKLTAWASGVIGPFRHNALIKLVSSQVKVGKS